MGNVDVGKVDVIKGNGCGVETILIPLGKTGRLVYACIGVAGMEKLGIWDACPV